MKVTMYSVFLASLLVAGCDSSSSITDTIKGTSAPASVGIVNDISTSNASISSAYTDTGSAYITDHVDTWVENKNSGRMLTEINAVLCVIGLTNSVDHPNANYRVQYDAKKCRKNLAQYNGPVNRTIIVKNTKATTTSPFEQTLWFQGPYLKGSGLVQDDDYVAKITITEAPSAASPLGLFDLTFESNRSAEGGVSYVGTEYYDGRITAYRENGSNYLKAMMKFGNSVGWVFDNYATMIIALDDSGGISGRASLDMPNNDMSGREAIITAFNGTHINEQVGTDSAVCSARTNMLETVWNYKLYYKDNGDLLDLNGGFPVTYEGTKMGWASRYDLWTDTAGDKPTVVTNSKTSQIYDVKRTAGKLIKKTKSTRSLTAGEVFVYWHNNGEYEVSWSGTTFTSTAENVTTALADLNNASASDSKWPWSRRLNQSIKYSGSSQVVYWTEEEVRPWSSVVSAGNLGLSCYLFCPEGTVSEALATADQWDSSAVGASNWSSTGKAFSFDAADMTLKYGTTPVVLDSSVTSTTNTDFDMRLVPTGSSVSDEWSADELAVHYIWRSGANDWNKSTNFKNQSTGAWYEFSAPISFEYTHSTANDRNGATANNGGSYYLEYDGGLNGIPDSLMADGSNGREISLIDGDIFAGKAKHLSRDLVIKAVGIGKYAPAASGQCDALPISGVTLTQPTISEIAALGAGFSWSDQSSLTGVAQGFLVIDGTDQE